MNRSGHTSITRRAFIRSLGGGAAAIAFGNRALAAEAGASGRPDVLFIAIEDISPHRFGCWGNSICKTPNTDKLAATGVRFDQAHSMTPVCNPSRTSLLTCLRPDTTKVYGNSNDWRKMAPQAKSMVEHFKSNGYETVRIGKIFHGSFEHAPSWSRVIRESKGMPPRKNKPRPPRGPDVEYARARRVIRELQRKGRKEEAAKLIKEKYKGAYGSPFIWGPTGLQDEEERDGMLAQQAVRVLEAKRDKPLFLALGFHAPHLPWRAPDKYFEMYPPDRIALPENPGQQARKSRDHRLLTEETWKEAIAAQYACLTFVDTQIGRVLDALKESGRADNTIIVLWSDHGYMQGEHFQWRKGQFYDESTRVALIIRAPGVTKPGSVCKRPVESVDIFPTLFELCGLPVPDGIEAVSMRPLLKTPARPWKKGAVMANRRGRSICTERYRYTESVGRKRIELYDRETDPGEFRNVAKDPKYADAVARLGKLLNGPWRGLLPGAE